MLTASMIYVMFLLLDGGALQVEVLVLNLRSELVKLCFRVGGGCFRPSEAKRLLGRSAATRLLVAGALLAVSALVVTQAGLGSGRARAQEPPLGDLAIELTKSAGPVTLLDELTYEIVVTNVGEGAVGTETDARGHTIETLIILDLPKEFFDAKSVKSDRDPRDVPCLWEIHGRLKCWLIAPLAPGESVTIHLTGTITSTSDVEAEAIAVVDWVPPGEWAEAEEFDNNRDTVTTEVVVTVGGLSADLDVAEGLPLEAGASSGMSAWPLVAVVAGIVATLALVGGGASWVRRRAA